MNNLNLSNYDVVFLIIIGASVIFATLKGGVSQLLSMSVWFISLFVTRNHSATFAKIIPEVVSNEMLRSLLAYIIAFVIIAVIIRIVRILFDSIIKTLGLGGLNIAIGALFGLARGIIICALIVLAIEMLGLDKTHSWKNSITSPIISPAVNMLLHNLDSIKI